MVSAEAAEGIILAADFEGEAIGGSEEDAAGIGWFKFLRGASRGHSGCCRGDSR